MLLWVCLEFSNQDMLLTVLECGDYAFYDIIV